jgi:hypothetical protein
VLLYILLFSKGRIDKEGYRQGKQESTVGFHYVSTVKRERKSTERTDTFVP